MRNIIIFSLLSTTFFSCDNKQKQDFDYKPLSEFKNDTSIIRPDTKVRVLAFSGSMDNNKDAIYYSQILVVNESNNDTLSILCPALEIPSVDGSENGVLILPTQYDPAKKVTEAVYERADSSLILMLSLLSTVEMSKGLDSSTTDLAEYTNGKYSKKELVAINKTLNIFQTQYKTVIGILRFSVNVGI